MLASMIPRPRDGTVRSTSTYPYPAAQSDHVRADGARWQCEVQRECIRSLSERELGKTDYIRGALTCAFIYHSALLRL